MLRALGAAGSLCSVAALRAPDGRIWCGAPTGRKPRNRSVSTLKTLYLVCSCGHFEEVHGFDAASVQLNDHQDNCEERHHIALLDKDGLKVLSRMVKEETQVRCYVPS